MAVTTMIGAKIHRREDPRLVSGEGRYVDDFTRPGTVFFAVVRSPHSHALIKSIDLTAASKAPGVVAVYTHKDFARVLSGTMTVWLSSQSPHFVRLFLAGALSIPENKIRVISPDVGGGFGSKISPYSEDWLVPAAAKMIGRPVKWIETRTESLQTTTHGRGQVFEVEAGAKKDGTLVFIKVTQYLDAGAYMGTFAAFQACACLLAGGAYNWKHVSARTVGVLTNRVPTDPYRGAGRPEATHLCERMIDLLAGELKMDAAAIRRKNFISEFPHQNHFGLIFDSGNYEKALSMALEMVGYEKLRQEQEDGRKKGRYLGIGLSSWIEICGFGPSAGTAPATGGIALVESAQVRVFPTGL